MQLLSLVYTQSQEHLRHYLIAEFGFTYDRMVSLMRRVCPDLSPVELAPLFYVRRGCVSLGGF